MLLQIAFGSTMIVVTTLIQGAFTMLGVEYIRLRVSRYPARSLFWPTVRLSGFVLWLFLATIIEVWIWAVLYLWLGALQSLEKAVYFSTVTFTTLGFGDITLDEKWRLLSSFEAANGLLMFGWSTALVFAAVKWTHEYHVQHRSRNQKQH